MMIVIDPAALDGIVRGWLKDTLQGAETNAAHTDVHPDDAKQYKKYIKALRHVLDYIGHD